MPALKSFFGHLPQYLNLEKFKDIVEFEEIPIEDFEKLREYKIQSKYPPKPHLTSSIGLKHEDITFHTPDCPNYQEEHKMTEAELKLFLESKLTTPFTSL